MYLRIHTYRTPPKKVAHLKKCDSSIKLIEKV